MTSQDHISTWLKDLGLAEYTTSFELNGISSGDLLVHVTAADLVDLRVYDAKDQKILLDGIQSLRSKQSKISKENSGENLRSLMNLLEQKIISLQDMQMMCGVLEGSIQISSHIISALKSSLQLFQAGSLSAESAGEVVQNTRRYVARILGLVDDDLLHPSNAPAALEADIQKLRDEIHKSLKGRREQARAIFACMDADEEGSLTIETFVSVLADLLPRTIERRRLRKFARRLDRDDRQRIFYDSFLEQFSTTQDGDKAQRPNRADSPYSSDDDVLIQRFAGRNHILRLPSGSSKDFHDKNMLSRARGAAVSPSSHSRSPASVKRAGSGSGGVGAYLHKAVRPRWPG